MIIDSSASVAVALLEEGRERLANAMAEADTRRISAATWLESCIVIERRKQGGVIARFEALVDRLQAEIVLVSVGRAAEARLAHHRFGRANHPARLNYGDCFAYALAKVTGEPLLFKGDDSSQTDITPALKT